MIASVYRAFVNVHDDLNYHFTIGFVSYFVIGYVLANYIDSKRRKLVGTGLGLILIGTIITFLEIRYASSKETTVVFLQHYQPGIFLQACGIFLFAKALSGSAFLKFFVKISPLTLGIYMLHPMIIEMLQKCGFTSLSFNPMIAVPILSLGIFFLSAIIIFILMKTPCKRILLLNGKGR